MKKIVIAMMFAMMSLTMFAGPHHRGGFHHGGHHHHHHRVFHHGGHHHHHHHHGHHFISGVIGGAVGALVAAPIYNHYVARPVYGYAGGCIPAYNHQGEIEYFNDGLVVQGNVSYYGGGYRTVSTVQTTPVVNTTTTTTVTPVTTPNRVWIPGHFTVVNGQSVWVEGHWQ